MAQTLLSEKKSTSGSPYAFYTVTVTPSNRTADSVTLSVTVKSHLQYSESYMGSGIVLTAGLYVGGSWRTLTLKSSSDYWSGTTVYTKSTSFTVTGLSATVTSLTGVQFRVTKTSGGSSVTTGGYLTATSVSNITIPSGNGKSSFTLSDDNINLGDSITATISRVLSTNYHKIVGSYGSNSYTFTSNAETSATLEFSESNFTSWFDSTVSSIDTTVTLTTYDSSETILGSASKTVTINIPESAGKPNKPTAIITEETENTVTIELTEPSTYNYGATFSSWEVSASSGTVTVSDNIITASTDTDKTVLITIRVVDSRGFKSDPIYVTYHIQEVKDKGYYIYKNGQWTLNKGYIYRDGAWVRVKNAYVFYDSKTLVSSDNNTLLSSDGLVLKGGEKWLIIR